MISRTFSEAFREQVKSLCLGEFPCGPGNWRSNYQWRTDDDLHSGSTKANSDAGNANLMSTESLQDLMKTATYSVDETWSKDIHLLRGTAAQTNHSIKEKDLYKKLTSLRLVNKDISLIDKDVLKFHSLKELILSANRLEKVDGRSLPPKLEVLELCGNTITDIQSLFGVSPTLLHLGVSYNQIKTINKPIMSSWTNLLSLDVSYNGLVTLSETVKALHCLPKLRSVNLQGNAISLSAVYRGYVIDSLKDLTILDERRISADERHHFRGLSKLPGLPSEHAIVKVEMKTLKGVKMPPKEENETGEPFPVIDYRYQIHYDFATEVVSYIDDVKSVDLKPGGTCKVLVQDTSGVVREGFLKATLKTEERHWQEEMIDISYQRSLNVTSLPCLRDFLKSTLRIRLCENKVIVGKDPEIEEEIVQHDNVNITGEAGNGDTQSRKVKRQLPKTSLPSHLKDQKAKHKGKDKQDDPDFYEISRETRTIGETSLDLSGFIDGDNLFSTNCIFEESETECLHTHIQSVLLLDRSCSSGKGLTESRKKGKEPRRNSAMGFSSSLPGRGKSALNARASKMDKSGKHGKESKVLKGITEVAEENEEPLQLSVDIRFELVSWKTAKEAQDWIKQFPNETN